MKLKTQESATKPEFFLEHSAQSRWFPKRLLENCLPQTKKSLIAKGNSVFETTGKTIRIDLIQGKA